MVVQSSPSCLDLLENFFIHFPNAAESKLITSYREGCQTKSLNYWKHCLDKSHFTFHSANHLGQGPGELFSLSLLTHCHKRKPEWSNQGQEKNKLKKINSQMFMHFTYTVPYGPLLGQRETTSVCFIGFMKCVSGTIGQEMLHDNSKAFQSLVLCLSTFNPQSIIKHIAMHNHGAHTHARTHRHTHTHQSTYP